MGPLRLVSVYHNVYECCHDAVPIRVYALDNVSLLDPLEFLR